METNKSQYPRIIAFPRKGTAYVDALYEAFRERSFPVEEGVWSGGWLMRNLRSSDIVHIHWPSFFYAARGNVFYLMFLFVRFVSLICYLRIKAGFIWWTAHNLLPHERCKISIFDVIARHIIIEVSNKIFVHGNEAGKVLCKRFPRAKKKIAIIPHGNFSRLYPTENDKMTSRKLLGIPENTFVYLLFGQCKPYKNVHNVIPVFLKQARATDLLIIAGKFSSESYLSNIRQLAADDKRVRVEARFLSNDEVPLFLLCSDVLCVPYREILTSGTAMLAMSFGKPVLSINRGFLRDVVTRETGFLIEPNCNDYLQEGLCYMREQKWNNLSIAQHAKRFTFDDAVQIMIGTLD